MKPSRIFFFLLLSTFPLQCGAAVDAGDLPGDTIWYLHADLDAMRTTEGGSKIYVWFNEEIGEEVNEEIGVDLNAEVDAVTAYSDATNGTVVVVDGDIVDIDVSGHTENLSETGLARGQHDELRVELHREHVL